MTRFRHATALALVGWYLMMMHQPIPKASQRPPLSEWFQAGSFDTADDCKQYQFHLEYDFVQKHLGGAGGPAQSEFDQIVTGECIASDDPRLKGK